MKNLVKLIVAGAMAVSFFACDKIEPPFVKKDGNDTTTQAARKVLLEEYTGHKCVFCPDAHQIAEDLKGLYGDKLVIVSIHAGDLAKPNSSGSFSYDFRTSTGNELDDFFQVSSTGLPKGMVNRGEVSGTKILEKGDWGATIAGIANLDPDADIRIINDYNASTRLLSVAVETEFLTALQGDYLLCVYITEDSIVNWQKTLAGDVADYVHRHALRGAVNSIWGDTVATSQVTNGQVVNKNYAITLNPEWNDNKCSVVAFIYRQSDNVVIQAEEKHIK